jgi:hypothetical protein
VRTRLIATLAGLGILALGLFGAMSVYATTPAKPPAGLNRSGKIVWNFEALLYSTFHTRTASAVGTSLNFTCRGFCYPSYTYVTYAPIFATATRSSYHLSRRVLSAGSFGNAPVPVRIKGHAIACDRAERHFLIAYANTVNFSLDCLAPSG